MSLVSKYPLVRPSQVVNFGKKTLLNSAVSYSRGSSGTYVDSNGLIRSAVVGEPRYTHDPDTLESLGLLLEEQRENFLTQSEHLDSGWVYQGGDGLAPTVTSVEAPDGGLDSRLYTLSSVRVRQDKTVPAAVYTLSVYYKPNATTILQIFLFNSAVQANVTFDTTDPNNPTVASGRGEIVNVGNGWYRASVTTLTATNGTVCETMIYPNGGYLWGAQLEAGSSPTSYIPTTTSAVTRAADHLSVPSSTARSGRIIFTPASSASPPVFALKSSDPSPAIPYEVDFSTFNSVPYGSVSYNSVRQGVVVPSSVPTSLPSVSALAFNFDKTTGALDLSTTATADEDSKVISLPAELSRPAPDGYELDVLDVNGGGGIALKEIYLWPEDLSVDKLASVSGELRSIGQAAETSTGFNIASDYRDAGARPSLDLRFAERKDLFDSTTEQNLVDFSRGSIGTYVDSNGVIQTAVDDEPRFDHDPVTGDSLGLLLEEARTNYYESSSNVTTIAGVLVRGFTAFPYSTTAPDGTQTADKVIETTAASDHIVIGGQSLSVVSGEKWTASLFVKPVPGSASNRYPALRLSGGTTAFGSYGVVFDLITKQSYVIRSDIYIDSGVIDYPNGWKRLYATAICDSTTTSATFGLAFYSFNSTNNLTSGLNYTGDGSSGFYLWGGQVEKGSFPTSYIPTQATFTSRASPATYYDANGIIQTAGPDVARDDAYFPDEYGIFRPAGLLLESGATNYIDQSVDLTDTGTWTNYKFNTPTLNAGTAPDGTNTATSLVPNTENVGRSLQCYNIATTFSGTLTVSVFAKANGYNQFIFFIDGASAGGAFGGGATFDLSTGTVTQGASGVGKIEKFPNGWYRCSVTHTNTAQSFEVWPGITGLDNSGNSVFTGDGTSGYLLWGFQLEESPYATSYIPTNGSEGDRAVDNSTSDEVTRVADEASITGTNFSSWYNQSESTLLFNAKLFGNNQTYVASFGVTGSVFPFARYLPESTKSRFDIYGPISGGGSTTFWGSLYNTSPVNIPLKGALCLRSGDYRACLNGLLDSSTQSSEAIPAFNELSLGKSGNNAYFMSGHISRLSYWPTRLSDTTLQTLTSTTTSTWDLIFDPSLSPDGVCAIITFGTTTYEVDWGDGTPIETINATGTYTATHRYTFPTTYTAKIDVVSGAFRPYYNNSTYADYLVEIKKTPDDWASTGGFGTSLNVAWYGANNLTKIDREIDTTNVLDFTNAWRDCTGLTSFPLINTSSGTDFISTWYNCTGLTSFPLINTSNGDNFNYAWYGCNQLTSFPLIDTSNATDFTYTWAECTGLTTFPLIDTSNATIFYLTWFNCNSLTSFPEINTSKATNFSNAWRDCTSLTSFPLIDTSSVTTFFFAWRNCNSLTTFPAGMFDTTGTLISTAFNQTFVSCALTSQSIGNILSSLDTNGQSNITLSINGGTNASSYDWGSDAWNGFYNLVNKGWTISYNDNLFSSSPLDLQFAATKTLDSRITFSRSSVGTYVDENGIIQTAAADVPRFDHDPETGESLGLLVEESRTNLCIQSETFTGSPFTLEGATASKTQIAPDGSTNATLITLTAGDTVHRVRESISTNRVLRSFFVKKSNCRYVYILDNNGGYYGPSYKIDLDTGIITLIRNSNLNSWPNYDFGISEFPNGYYRVWFDAVQINMWAMYPSNINYLVGQSIPVTFNADGTEQFIIWGYQVEAGTFPTSYIATNGTPGVTRSADEADITGTNFSSWYNPTEGSFFMDEKNSYGIVLAKRFELIQNSSPNANSIAFNVNYGAGTRISARDSGAPGSLDTLLSNVWTSGGNHKYGYGLKLNDSVAVSGSNIATDSDCTLPPNLDALDFGAPIRSTPLSNTGGKFTLSRLTYWPKRLPDGALQFITS